MMADRQEEKKTFDDFYLSKELLQALAAIGYKHPTPVQSQSIPLIMAGIDLIVQSQTGTGKTAAFGIPVIEMLDPEPGRVEVLVLAPTRELAKQVSDEFTRLTQYRPIHATAIYGGSAYAPQLEALKTAQIVCATPGRLLDLLKQREMTLEHLRFFILDEADEMLSMGFERDLRAILEYLPDERQSLLFSATVTEEVRSLSRNMLFHPEFLSFSSDSVVNRDVTHAYYSVSGIGRMRDLIKILEFEEPDNAIIFANTKDDTFLVNNFLQRHGYRAEVLNGDLPQVERERTLGKLRRAEINYLVATDVAARGIDISDLSHVINYVLPDSPEVYVHRTGRTGRAGKKGTAISLVSPAEMTAFIMTRKRVDMEISERPLPTTRDIVRAKLARRSAGILERVEQFSALPTQPYLGAASSLNARLAELEPAQRDTLLATLLAIADHALDAQGELKRVSAAAPLEAKPAREAEATPQHTAPAPVEAEEEDAQEEVAAPAPVEARPAPAPTAPATSEEEEESESEEEVELTEEDLAPMASPFIEDEEEDGVAARKPSSSDEEDDDQERGRGRRGRRRRRGGSSRRQRDEQRDEPQQREESRSAEASERPSRSSGASRRDRRSSSDSRSNGSSSSSSRQERSSRAPAPPAPAPAPAAAPAAADHDMSKMWLSQGKNVFKESRDVLDFLVYNSGMDEEDFGEIKLERAHTYVDVRTDYIQDVIGALDNIEVEGSMVSARVARR